MIPRSYLAPGDPESMAWRRDCVRTLLERDLPQLGVRVPAEALQRFWMMLAHYHAQTWNSAEPARALGVNPSSTNRYLDLLTDALMIRQLQPRFATISDSTWSQALADRRPGCGYPPERGVRSSCDQFRITWIAGGSRSQAAASIMTNRPFGKTS